MKYTRPRNEDLMMDTSLPTSHAASLTGAQRFRAAMRVLGGGAIDGADAAALLDMLGLSVSDVMPRVDCAPDDLGDSEEADALWNAEMAHDGHDTP